MPPHITASLTTFLTNLRLLDLDYEEDWPNITAELFAVKNARANQKQRIQCVEWALYRLFEIWNPKEAKNKLQPFFPAYEGLRSINLRAALFRSFNELKKDGVLGKEIIIRKTMFDECRGEMFEELLAAFSTLVVQKHLRSKSCVRSSIVGRLVTSQRLPEYEQQSLLPLAIAHRGALQALLRRKKLLRERYANLRGVLKAKEQELLTRVEDLAQDEQDCPLDAVPDRAVETIRQHFQRNWQGDTRWINFLVEGDRRDFNDPLLNNAFSAVWERTENGEIDRVQASGNGGLLQDLNRRVREQQTRLRYWQQIQQELIQSRPKSPIKARDKMSPYRNRGVQSPLKFGHVDQYNVESSLKALSVPLESKTQYSGLLEQSLRKIETSDMQGPRTPTKVGVYDLISTVESKPAFPSHVHESAPPATPERVPHHMDYFEQRPTSISHIGSGEPACPSNQSTISPSHVQKLSTLKAESQIEVACDVREVFDGRADSQRDKGSYHESLIEPDCNGSTRSEMQSQPAVGRISDHEENAPTREINSSALDAELSPTKYQSSLMERTRQSIAFSKPEAFLPDAFEGPALVHSASQDQGDRMQHAPTDRSTSLLERTRRSISLLPASVASSHGPRKSLYGRRQSKQYPRNQFETPKKLQLEDLKEMTPPEVLFSPEADYASVFKSRPKVATSPRLSPVLAGRLPWDCGGGGAGESVVLGDGAEV